MKALGTKSYVSLALIFMAIAAIGFGALVAFDRLLGG
jgi:hypothetical protein